jgi:hypothetical protein
MADTALTKAIEKIKADSEYKHIHYQSACDKAIQILTDLLPYERETIEAAYEDGSTNLEFGTPSYVHKTDYFTKTYNQ